MTVGELRKQLTLLVDKHGLKEEDIVYILGTGDKDTQCLSGVAMPLVILKERKESIKGYYCLGFVRG